MTSRGQGLGLGLGLSPNECKKFYPPHWSDALLLLNGFQKTAAQEWTGISKNHVPVQNGSTTGSDTNDVSIMPIGYRGEGDDYLTTDVANLNLPATITEFTIIAVCVTNIDTENNRIFSQLFGPVKASDRPFMIHTESDGSNQFRFRYVLDNANKSIDVTNADTFITQGKPYIARVLASVGDNVKLYVDGVERGDDTSTGLEFDQTTGDVFFGSSNVPDNFLNGEIRYFLVLDKRLSVAEASSLESLLTAQGFMDSWRDNFSKWSSNVSVSNAASTDVANSPYECWMSSSDLTATAGFEVKDGRKAMFTKISANAAAGTEKVYSAIVLNGAAAPTSQTSTTVLTLPGVVAAETLNIDFSLYADDISGANDVALEIMFFDDTGTQQGSTTTYNAITTDAWEDFSETLAVPASSTRMNASLTLTAAAGETPNGWISEFKINR